MLNLVPLYHQVHLHFQNLGRVEALLLTTFGLDVSYLEKSILPAFFPELGEGPASEPHRPLYEYLEEHPVPISILFDTNNLVRGDKPIAFTSSVIKELRWQAHPMQGRNGCFHPKLILALVRNEERGLGLVFGCGSANLTQAGWGRNIEAYVLDTIWLKEGMQNSMLVDLQELLDDFSQRAVGSESLAKLKNELSRINPQPFAQRRYQLDYKTRFWHAAKNKSLRHFLSTEVLKHDLKNEDDNWALDVFSPYYSVQPPEIVTWARDLMTSEDDAVSTPKVVCFCPKVEGQFDISPEIAENYANAENVAWGSLPDSITRSRLKNASGEVMTRVLHAKVYRFWCSEAEVFVVGSANATTQGCRDGGDGNDEACLIFSRPAIQGKSIKSWLNTLDGSLEEHSFRPEPSLPDDQGRGNGLPHFNARFDWVSHQLDVENKSGLDIDLFLGQGLHPFMSLKPKASRRLKIAGDQVGAIFRSPTLRIAASGASATKWLYLIEELNLQAKPPAPTMERTADELIQDWQQGFDERFANHVAMADSAANAIADISDDSDWSEDPQSDRMNDLFLALWRFRKDIEQLLGSELKPDDFSRSRIQSRVFGRGAMSVRYFVDRINDASTQESMGNRIPFDSVDLYVCLLTIIDAIKLLAPGLKKIGFHKELRNLKQDLVAEQTKARKRLLKDLKLEGSDYPPQQLLDWVEKNYRHRAAMSKRPTA